MQINVISQSGKAKSEDFNFDFVSAAGNELTVAKYVRAYLSNQRQANAKVKDRSEVSGGGRKPWRQKGTGRARQGSIRSPQWTKGGVVFGPTGNENHKLKINKKESFKAFAAVVKSKVEESKLSVLEISKLASTKEAAEVLSIAKLDKTVLLLSDNDDVKRYFANLPQVKVSNTADVSAYDLLKNDAVVFERDSYKTYFAKKEEFYNKYFRKNV